MNGSNPLKNSLSTLLGERVQFDVPMGRHTYIRVGGPADILAFPDDPEEMAAVIRLAGEHGMDWRVIGDGTNLLVRDGGVRGILIVPGKGFGYIRQSPAGGKAVRVTAGAGVKMPTLCRYAAKNGLAGMNFAVGIPGTVGGGLMMNAGTAEGTMADVVESIHILDRQGRVRKLSKNQLRFSYRRLSWQDSESEDLNGTAAVTGASFSLTRSDAGMLMEEAGKRLEIRRKTQPMGQPSAGCFFKNPETGRSAGELIDRAGLKGKRVGGAAVSEKHANFIINRGDATAAEILELGGFIQKEVSVKFDVDLEFEVKIVGC